jgi:hypothetical protein
VQRVITKDDVLDVSSANRTLGQSLNSSDSHASQSGSSDSLLAAGSPLRNFVLARPSKSSGVGSLVRNISGKFGT